MSDTTGVSARLRDGLGMVSIATPHGRAAALAQALRDHAGLTPPAPGCWVGDDALALLWTAPGQFLAVGDAAATQRLADALRERALLIDLTGARVVVRLSGKSVRDVLARVVPLDLHPRAMRPGRVASTIAAQAWQGWWQSSRISRQGPEAAGSCLARSGRADCAPAPQVRRPQRP